QVAHVDVTHAPRQSGRSKYGNLDRALVGIVDLFGVAWLIRRRKRARAQMLTTDARSEPAPAPALAEARSVPVAGDTVNA
ncbi:MAG: hypothetical protein ACK4TJ_13035, partial [Tabrizicola sp.]